VDIVGRMTTSAYAINMVDNKVWYKHWWGVILAILIWPFFLIWLAWAKTKWGNEAKVAVTIGEVVAALVILTAIGSTLPAKPVSSPKAAKASVPAHMLASKATPTLSVVSASLNEQDICRTPSIHEQGSQPAQDPDSPQ
jgi:hypothetical protein